MQRKPPPASSANRGRHAWSDADRLSMAKALRGFGDGFVSLLLPVHLLLLGFTPFQVGCIATTTLLGSGLLTLLAARMPAATPGAPCCSPRAC